MPLNALLLLAVLLQLRTSCSAQAITLHEKNAPLKKVLDQVRKQSHYEFFFTTALLRSARPVTIDLKAVDLKEALRRLFANQPIDFVINDHTIVLNDRPPAPLLPVKDPILNSGLTIVGSVTNENGSPLSGAVVLSKYHQAGTTTGLNGIFRLKDHAESDTIVVSYIGFKTKTVPINMGAANCFLSIKLEEATSGLDAIVIQGYGRTSQHLTTGDIGRVTAAEIEKQPITDPLLAIEGRVAGVVVTPLTGYEGGPIKIEIRGRNAINPAFPTDPLYVIDGVPLTILDVNGTIRNENSNTYLSRGLDQTGLSSSGGQSPLYMINPFDIESIDILKDADATAIYGSRGANGVILITTKKGKVGRPVFDLNIGEGISSNTRSWPLLHTHDYLVMRHMQLQNDGITPSTANAPDLLVWDTTRYVNWSKILFGEGGQNTKINAAFSTGKEQANFRIGLGYDRIVPNALAAGINQRASVSFNLSGTSFNKKLVTYLTGNYSYTIINQLGYDQQIFLPPDAPDVYDKNGKLNWLQWDQSGVSIPFANLLQPYNSKNNGLTSNLSISYTILKGLVAKVSLGYNINRNDQNRFSPIASMDPYTTTTPTGSASFGKSRASNWIVEQELTYSVDFGKHTIDFLTGASLQHNVTDALTVNGYNYTNDNLLRTISGAQNVSSNESIGQYKYAGFFSRISYNYDNKYLLNLNGRRDGSSRFASGSQFGNFGSVGVGWVASDETPIRTLLPKVLNFLKFRGSYGITGSDAVGDYAYLSQWSTIAAISPNSGTSILLPTIEPNTKFHWQVNKKAEVAIQTQWWQGRIGLDLVYYRDRCNSQLISYPLDQFTGFTSVVANRPANLQNSGLEAIITAPLIRKKDVSWTIGFNIGINRNKLLSYPDLQESAYRNQLKIGKSANLLYLLNYTGVDPLTGKYTFTDYNHDGQVTENAAVFPGTGNDDRRIVIDEEPNYTGGISTSFSYYGFAMMTSFTFVRQKGQNMLAGGTSLSGGLNNIASYVYAHMWTHPGQTNALFTKASATSYLNGDIGNSNLVWSDASFFRMSSLVLSYRIPKRWVRKTGLAGMTFNISTHNLLVLSPYHGLDPEVRTFGGLPPARTINSSLSFSF